MPRELVLRIEVKGIDQVIRNLGIAQDAIKDVVGEALRAEGESILEEAKMECPTQTGTLKDSGFVTGPVQEKEDVHVVCGFGTDNVVNPLSGVPTSQYAVPVHERLDVNHPVGKAKFLEDPARRASGTLEGRVGDRVARLVGR